MDEITMGEFYADSRKENIMVIVYRSRRSKKPLALIEIERAETETCNFIINYVKVDTTVQGQRIGSGMITRLTDRITCKLYRQKEFEICLEAVKTRTNFYKNKGYKQYAQETYSPGWGILVPMKRNVGKEYCREQKSQEEEKGKSTNGN